MTPRERAFHYVTSEKGRKHLGIYEIGDSEAVEIIEGAILADRQALQSEILKAVDRLFMNLDGVISAERKACLKIVNDLYQDSIDNNERCEYVERADTLIRARSNQPEEKEADAKIKTVPIVAHENLEAYSYYVEKVNDWQSSRIAMMHEWQARDAQTIERLNASNQKLSEENYALREKTKRLERSHFGSIFTASERDRQKIAQLEKEKHELTQQTEFYQRDHSRLCDGPGYCTLKPCSNSRPAS